MEKLFDQILTYITVAGSLTTLAYFLVKHFGKKSLDNYFQKSLEEYKRKQQEILENLKFSINSKFNRVTKIHEKEFEILPIAWYKLQETYIHFKTMTSFMQYWPNLDRYTEKELKAFLEKSELFDFQKEELLKADKKLEYYQEKIYWIRLKKLSELLNDFRVYLTYNKIFLSRNLSNLFSEMEIILIEAESILEVNTEYWKNLFQQTKKLHEEGPVLIDKIELEVQSSLLNEI